MTSNPAPQTHQKVVLLVDDDPLIIRMYQRKLAADGYHVLIASNGEEALAQVVKTKPRLILLDVMMPKMNGVETLKALKGQPNTKDIPVVILTNLGDNPQDVENAKKLGALDYLVKSNIDLKTLSAKVREVTA